MKVTVAQGVRVCYEGKAYRGGESAGVPERLACHWIHRGWASEGDGAATLRDPRRLPGAETLSAPTKPHAKCHRVYREVRCKCRY
jgi:hypothetical protein